MLFYNEDWTHYLMIRFADSREIDENELKQFIYQYKGTQITDFILNVNGSVSSAPSKVLQTFAQKYCLTNENGIDVDYKNMFAKVAYDIQCRLGVDQYKIWVDTLREIGIRPWISIRMNDTHDNLLNAGLRKTSYTEQHPELWCTQHRAPTKYFDRTYNYNLSVVRERMLAYIEEMLTAYMPDGLELDFIREMNLFTVGAEYDSFDTLTGFLQSVKALVHKTEQICGHEIKIGVLLPCNITTTFNMGYDVYAWCEQNLVDFVTIAPRWETINPNMDIGLWKRLLSKNVQLGTCLQLLVRPTLFDAHKMALIDHDYGQAVANLSLGADFIYLYNHFYETEQGLEVFMIDNSIRETENLNSILCNVATLDTAMQFKRRHILTYDDFYAPWQNEEHRLPLLIDKRYLRPDPAFAQVRIAVGKTNPNDTIELVLGFDQEIELDKLHLYVNSRKIQFKKLGGRFDGKENAYTFAIPNDLIHTYAVVELGYDGSVQLTYAEIVVEVE